MARTWKDSGWSWWAITENIIDIRSKAVVSQIKCSISASFFCYSTPFQAALSYRLKTVKPCYILNSSHLRGGSMSVDRATPVYKCLFFVTRKLNCFIWSQQCVPDSSKVHWVGSQKALSTTSEFYLLCVENGSSIISSNLYLEYKAKMCYQPCYLRILFQYRVSVGIPRGIISLCFVASKWKK